MTRSLPLLATASPVGAPSRADRLGADVLTELQTLGVRWRSAARARA